MPVTLQFAALGAALSLGVLAVLLHPLWRESRGVVAGMALNLVGTNPIRMLFLSAVVNGLLAPPLLVLVMLVGNNRAIMGTHANGPWLNALGWLATTIMFVAAIGFFVTSL